MENEPCEFDKLPLRLLSKAANKLSTHDLMNLAINSKRHCTLFKPLLDIRKLLHHVVRSEHDAAVAILNNDVNLIFKKGRVTDCSGRTFKNISAFQYALWALDKHLWMRMLICVCQNEGAEKIRAKLHAHYQQIKTTGAFYKLNGKKINETHFSFERVIKAMQTQVEYINAPGWNNRQAIAKQWREEVGSEQRLFPMHVVHEYCSPNSFRNLPLFTSRPEPSTKFFNLQTQRDENWFNSKLGVDLAIFKGVDGVGTTNRLRFTTRTFGGPEGKKAGPGIIRHEIAALKKLAATRKEEFNNLEAQLNTFLEHSELRDTLPPDHNTISAIRGCAII